MVTAKSNPITLRLSPATAKWVDAEAERVKRSRSAIIEALTEEAARVRRFPGIAFRGPEHDRRPWMIGTALDIWQIIEAYKDFKSTEEMVSESDLAERQIVTALAYYEQYPEEIDTAIADNRRSPGELRDLYPAITYDT